METTRVDRAAGASSDPVQDQFSRDVQKRLDRLRGISRVCTAIGIVLFAIVVVLALSVTVLPRVMGMQSYAIVSGSMEPNFPVGSLVYAEPVLGEELLPGDVAVFWRSGDVIVHRVEENDYEKRELITRGDANDGIDAHPAHYDNVVGRAVTQVPGIGYFVIALSSLAGKFVLGWVVFMGAAFAIVGTVISSLAQR